MPAVWEERFFVLPSQFPTGDVVKLCLILMGAISVLALLVWLAKRALLSGGGKVEDDWSLQHLRDLRAGGQITDQEFETLKQRMLAAIRLPETRKDGAAPDSKDDSPPSK